MRSVWASACLLLLICALSQPAGLEQSLRLVYVHADASSATGPPGSGAPWSGGDANDKFFDDQFVYVAPPKPVIVDDPKFYREGFSVAQGGVGGDPVKSSERVANPPEPQSTARPVTPAPATPVPTATPTASVRPKVSEVGAPVNAGTQAVQQSQLFFDNGPLFHEFRFSLTPTSTSVAWGASAPKAATATPVVALTASPQTAPVVDNRVDIEDPRFYRGSFKYAPAGSIQAEKGSAGYSPAPSYKGTSYETLSPDYSAGSPLPVAGKAMYYNPGIMQQVLAYRMQLGQVAPCGECVGYVALLRKGDLGRRVWLRWSDGAVEGPFLVIDVAARHHVSLLLSRGWAVDVDYATAMRHGMNRPAPVTVLASP